MREKLAQQLHWKMEHLEPTEDSVWGDLSVRQKEFYRLLVDDILAALSEPSEAMLDAGMEELGVLQSWQAMLKAAGEE